jgi:hypothetical protein
MNCCGRDGRSPTRLLYGWTGNAHICPWQQTASEYTKRPANDLVVGLYGTCLRGDMRPAQAWRVSERLSLRLVNIRPAQLVSPSYHDPWCEYVLSAKDADRYLHDLETTLGQLQRVANTSSTVASLLLTTNARKDGRLPTIRHLIMTSMIDNSPQRAITAFVPIWSLQPTNAFSANPAMGVRSA